MKIRQLFLVSIFWLPIACLAEINFRQSGPSEYEFVLTSNTMLSEQEAMEQVRLKASVVCGEKTPILGKYRFEGSEALTGSDKTKPGKTKYVFTQEVSCESGAKTNTVQRLPKLKNAEQAQSIKNEIKRMSEQYIQDIASKNFSGAYAKLDIHALSVDQIKWKNSKAAFADIAGKPLDISIKKLTIYDNPMNAPEAGIYVAADFVNVYQNVPLQCGYIVWFSPDGINFRITREDTGYFTPEQLKAIPSEKLPEMKHKFHCVDS